MAGKILTIEQTLTLLAYTPQRLVAFSEEAQPIQLHTSLGQDEWSANDVLAHLRACADVWGNCIRVLLAEDMPTLRAINPKAWIKKTNYRELEFGASARAFAEQRAELLTVLKPLTPEKWARKAILTGAGKPLERTVISYAQRLARHERPHIKQIETILHQISSYTV